MTDYSHSADNSGWDFRLVFQHLRTVHNPLQLLTAVETNTECPLLSFDAILAKLPRVRYVRLYASNSTRRNMMWDAVQQAFAFFATAEGGAVVVGADSPSFTKEVCNLLYVKCDLIIMMIFVIACFSELVTCASWKVCKPSSMKPTPNPQTCMLSWQVHAHGGTYKMTIHLRCVLFAVILC